MHAPKFCGREVFARQSWSLGFCCFDTQFQIQPGEEPNDYEKESGDCTGQTVVLPRVAKRDVERIAYKQIGLAGDSALGHLRAAGCQKVDEIEIIEVESKA